MPIKKLHPNEHDIDTELVVRLIASQFPQWADLPVRPVTSIGTVHVLYHLGETMVVRLPRSGVALEEIDKEHTWLPRLAPLLPVPIPVPLGRGEPTPEYPCVWSVYSWLEGTNPEPGSLNDPIGLAQDLAAFITALQALDTTGAPRSERGSRTLESLNASALEAIQQARELVDTASVTAAWGAALSAPAWNGHAVWVHADLFPGNLLVESGRLSGVIDLGSLGTGDPASDLTVAWSILPLEGRQVFQRLMGADEAAWRRARGLALVIALQALPYYIHTNPSFAGIARYTIAEVLTDHRQNAS
jgi:aminoglycoside phosphotransferase (APT) family kinase protein